MPELGREDMEESAQCEESARNSMCRGPVAGERGPCQHTLPPGSVCRCGCVTMLKSPNKTTAVKQWEQRWIKNCLCGGLWRRMPLNCP